MVLAYLFWQLWQGWHWPVLGAPGRHPLRGRPRSRRRHRAGRHAPSLRCVDEHPAGRDPRPPSPPRRSGLLDLEPVERVHHARVLQRPSGVAGRCQPLLRAAHHHRCGRGRRPVPAFVLQTHPHRRGHAGRRRRSRPRLAGGGAIGTHRLLRVDDRRHVRRVAGILIAPRPTCPSSRSSSWSSSAMRRLSWAGCAVSRSPSSGP